MAGYQVVHGLKPDLAWDWEQGVRASSSYPIGFVQELQADSLINHRCALVTGPV